MNAKDRVVVNTSAQYLKTIISGIITLYSSRVILQSLGSEDFGIYSLIAGVVMMLSFFTNALSSTTQRYLSLYQGRNDEFEVKRVFSSSVALHLIIGLVIIALFLLLSLFLFNGFLNIEESRIGAARIIYYAVVCTLFLSFITTPFRAALISHENIVFISVVDVLDVTLKLFIALSLSKVSLDKLVYYGWMLSLIQLANLLIYSFYCRRKYQECASIKREWVEKKMIKDIGSFASWNIYSIGCTYGRTQGLAIIVNKFLGTIMNASYGIAIQLSSYVNYMSESLLNAVRPQIIKAEGENNRTKMFSLSEKACKYSFFLISLVSIPCIFEMPTLLRLWLGDYPDGSVILCQFFLIAICCDSLTIGLHISNQATGRLKKYALVINTIKLTTLVFGVLFLKLGYGIFSVGFVYAFIELICAIIRIPLLKEDGLDIQHFFYHVFLRVLPCAFACVSTCIILTSFSSFHLRIIFTFVLSFLVYLISFCLIGLTKQERLYFGSIINGVKAKVFKK